LRTNRIGAWKNKVQFAISEAEKVDKKNNKNCARIGVAHGKNKRKFAISEAKKLIKRTTKIAH
jgi:hypothetical protein